MKTALPPPNIGDGRDNVSITIRIPRVDREALEAIARSRADAPWLYHSYADEIRKAIRSHIDAFHATKPAAAPRKKGGRR